MLGFLIAALLGFLTPQAEGPVAGPIVKVLKGYFAIEQNETRLIAFMVMLLVAAIIAALLESGTTFGVILGAIVGYFGARIFVVIKKLVDGRPDPK